MIYFATPSSRQIREVAEAGWVGLIDQPNTGYTPTIVSASAWIADNGVFGADGTSKFSEPKWLTFLAEREHLASRCVFAVVPDVVSDHHATLDQWDHYADMVTAHGFRPAFACQDGCTPDEIPDDAAAVFIGGSTHWKLSRHARACVDFANSDGRWTHMGRVNTRKRVLLAASWGCDSVDGTCAAFGPDINFPRILAWMEEAATREPLLLEVS